jgi:hypothetical protein
VAAQDPNRDRASAELLRRTLASEGSVAEPCPGPEILAAYAERSLDADETAHYELHFAQCATCRDQLAAMVRAAAPAPRPPRISWIWNWGWIALAPVTAVLLIAALFIARQSKRESPSVAQLQPFVAMSPSDQPKADIAAPPSGALHQPPPSETAENRIARAARANPAGAPNAETRPAAPNKADVTVVTKSQSSAAEVTTAPAETDLKQRSISNLPTAARNYVDLKKLSPSPAAPPQPGKGADDRNRDQVRAQPQAVTVESDVATGTTQASPQDSLADNSASNAGGALPSARNPATTHSTFAAGAVNQMVVVEAPLDRSARTLVQSPDPEVLWRISGGRYVERSADSGATWRTQWTNASAHVVAGSAPSADTCWLVGDGGIVLLSTDARKWHTITPPEVEDFTAVSASDAESATITTKDGRQFKTRDGGKHWTPAP